MKGDGTTIGCSGSPAAYVSVAAAAAVWLALVPVCLPTKLVWPGMALSLAATSPATEQT